MQGLKYLPFALYKMRTLEFSSDAIAGLVPPARETRPRGEMAME
jgi:hypothetical protein